MSKLAGYSVLVLGVLGLGAWGTMKHAPDMEAFVTEGAAIAAAGTALPLDMAVSGRDITVSGVVETEAERDLVLQRMNTVGGHRVVRSDLTLPPMADPHVIEIAKRGGALTASGMVANEAGRLALSTVVDAEGLELRRGAAGDWKKVVLSGVDALGELNSGQLQLSGDSLTLTGEALNPAARDAAVSALGGLPGAITTDAKIDVLDDGQPFQIWVRKGADGLTAEGKLPASMSAVDMGLGDAGLATSRIAAPDGFEQQVTDGMAALALLEDGELQVDDRGTFIFGTAADPAAREAAIAAVGNANDTDIAVLDDGAPFAFSAVKGDGLTASGKLPKGFDLAASGYPADDVVISGTAGPDGYGDRVRAGLEALTHLEQGALEVDADGLRLTGGAASIEARDAAMAALPDGVDAEIDAPKPAPVIAWTAADGVTQADNVAPADVASVLRGGDADLGVAGPALGALSPWMPNVDAFAFDGSGLDVTVSPGVDAGQVQQALAADLPDTALTVAAPTQLPAEGAERVNAITGDAELFTGSAWLPKIAFAATEVNCRARLDDVLGSGEVTFLSGSAELDARASHALSALAAVMRRCELVMGDGVEVGGHTDSTGDAALNERLSQQRAEAVVAALGARGIDTATITAKGYGPLLPIADNATEEGRAANRRTTITWAE